MSSCFLMSVRASASSMLPLKVKIQTINGST